MMKPGSVLQQLEWPALQYSGVGRPLFNDVFMF